MLLLQASYLHVLVISLVQASSVSFNTKNTTEILVNPYTSLCYVLCYGKEIQWVSISHLRPFSDSLLYTGKIFSWTLALTPLEQPVADLSESTL